MDVSAILYQVLYWLAIVNLGVVFVCTFLLGLGGVFVAEAPRAAGP